MIYPHDIQRMIDKRKDEWRAPTRSSFNDTHVPRIRDDNASYRDDMQWYAPVRKKEMLRFKKSVTKHVNKLRKKADVQHQDNVAFAWMCVILAFCFAWICIIGYFVGNAPR